MKQQPKDRSGAFFVISPKVRTEFDRWCEDRPWMKKGQFVEALLIWVVRTFDNKAIGEVFDSAYPVRETPAAELDVAARRALESPASKPAKRA